MPDAHTPADLFALAEKNLTVAAHLSQWKAGGFACLEDCLLSLTVALARENERYLQTEIKRLLREPKGPIIPEGLIEAHRRELVDHMAARATQRAIEALLHLQPVKQFDPAGRTIGDFENPEPLPVIVKEGKVDD